MDLKTLKQMQNKIIRTRQEIESEIARRREKIKSLEGKLIGYSEYRANKNWIAALEWVIKKSENLEVLI